jgi:hypothetical protein
MPRVCCCLICLVMMLMPISGGVDAQTTRPRANDVQARVVALFERSEYKPALDLIVEYLKTTPNDPAMLYNAACAQARLGHADEAASALLESVKAGYRNFEHMRGDPDLASLHDHPTYQAIVEASERVAAEAGKSAVERWRTTYGTKAYRYETDDKRRINYATALDEDAHQRMRIMLEREADQLTQTLFGNPPAYYVLIAIPTPEDSDKFFDNNDSVGGMYDHTQRRLVARDIGGSLRHEFFHAFHFGDMERRQQQHPLWIQEGLACLYEDYAIDDAGTIVFVPNDRQVIVKNRARAGVLIKWADLFDMTAERFMRKAPEMYPQVRSIFEFVAAQGQLSAWYQTYTEHFAEDRTGRKAFELTFHKPLAEIERAWREWVRQQAPAPVQLTAGETALGIRSRENASNDGVLVTQIVVGSAAARARMRVRDVIVSVDGQDTTTLSDLRRILAQRSPGDKLELRIRRSGEYLTLNIILPASQDQ